MLYLDLVQHGLALILITMIKTKKETYSILKKIPLVLPQNFSRKLDSQINVTESYIDLIKKKLTANISDMEIYKKISNTNSLCFQLAQSCNLRCSYCIYSGIYKSMRVHQSKIIPFLTAKKALNIFFKQYSSSLRTSRKTPVISFYGGEPLLGFDTLVKITQYANKLKQKHNRDLDFMINTNGIILDKDKIKFFVKENFVIDVSLDGPKSEHDRYRLKYNGNGSFEDVFENILYIKSHYPDYFKDKIRFKITLHSMHDLLAIEDFFLSNNDIFSNRNVFISQVIIDDNLEKETKEIWSKYRENQVDNYYKNGSRDSWFFHKFFFESLDLRFQSKGTPLLTSNFSFTSTCFPGGEKIFVDANGQILICEKCMEDIPIGNVNRGFDTEVIRKIVIEWRKNIINRKCWECGYWYYCPMCFASNRKNNRFYLTREDCNEVIARIKKRINRYIEQKEMTDEMDSNNYNIIFDFLHSL